MVTVCVTKCVIFLCLLNIAIAAVAQNSQPIELNGAAVQISPEDKKSNDESSDLETAEFKHFFKRKLGHGIPVQPVYVQPYIQPIPVQPVPIPVPVHVQPVPYHVHTPDCGCNGGGYQGGHSYGYNYNYHYNNY